MGYFQNWVVNSPEPEKKIENEKSVKKILQKNEVKPEENTEKIIVIDFEKTHKEPDSQVIVQKVGNSEKPEKKTQHNSQVFVQKEDPSNTIYIYTDGGCIHNGKKNAKAGVGVFFAEGDPRNVSKPLEGKQSNNAAELEAIIQAIKLAKPEIEAGKKIVVFTDSEYAIKCFTSYGRKLAMKGWTQDKPIPNFHKVKYGFELYNKYPNVRLQHIRAHTGKQDAHSIGNDWADKLASAGIHK